MNWRSGSLILNLMVAVASKSISRKSMGCLDAIVNNKPRKGVERDDVVVAFKRTIQSDNRSRQLEDLYIDDDDTTVFDADLVIRTDGAVDPLPADDDSSSDVYR